MTTRDPNEQERERCMALSREWGDFVLNEDGYYVYWPSNDRSRGYLGPHHLRWLADELDKMNEAWDKQVQAQFTTDDYIEQEVPERE